MSQPTAAPARGARPHVKLSFDQQRPLQHVLDALGKGSAGAVLLERETGVTIHARGQELHLEGPEAELGLVARLLEQMYALANGGRPVDGRDVARALDVLRGEGALELKSVFDQVLLPQALGGRGVGPRSLAQKRYVAAMQRYVLTFGVGPAGTGKTFLAVAMAVRALQDRDVRRILLSRPAIEAGEHLGFLPGTLEEKISPYLRPLYDALRDMLEPAKVQAMLEEGTIEIAPLAYMRGRTLNDAFVILDEAQNTTREQMKMFLTRIGNGTRAVVTGDPSQVDLGDGRKSGLAHALRVLRGVEGVAVAPFGKEDVMRNPLVQRIVEAYELDAEQRATRASVRRGGPEGAEPEGQGSGG
jgi:phosphate starvation-inducible PhoH-like protein